MRKSVVAENGLLELLVVPAAGSRVSVLTKVLYYKIGLEALGII